MIASSAGLNTVDWRTFGPIGASAVVDLLRHFWTVVGKAGQNLNGTLT